MYTCIMCIQGYPERGLYLDILFCDYIGGNNCSTTAIPPQWNNGFAHVHYGHCDETVLTTADTDGNRSRDSGGPTLDQRLRRWPSVGPPL